MIALLYSRGNLSSPYKIIETNPSLVRLDKPYESNVACARMKRQFFVDGTSDNAERNVPCPQRRRL